MTGLTKMGLRRDLLSGQETTYYVLIKDRVSVGVETTSWMAEQRARELSTAGSPCTIVETTPNKKSPEPAKVKGFCGECENWY